MFRLRKRGAFLYLQTSMDAGNGLLFYLSAGERAVCNVFYLEANFTRLIRVVVGMRI